MRAGGGSGGDGNGVMMEEVVVATVAVVVVVVVNCGGCRRYPHHASPHTIDSLMHDILATQARCYALPAQAQANVCSERDV